MRGFLLLVIVGSAFGYQAAAEQQFPSKEKTATKTATPGKHKKPASSKKKHKTVPVSKPQ